MDYDKLASSLGGSLLDNDYDKLATQFGGQLVQPPEPVQPPVVALSPEEQMMSSIGQGSGTELKDIGKLATASAVKSLLGSPEAIQAAGSGVARDTTFGPMEAVNYLTDPRKLTNTLAGAVGMKPIFDEAKGPIPEEMIAKEKAAVDEALTKGKIESLRDLTKYGSEVSKMIEDTVSPEMKEALALSEPTGNIIKTLDQKVFGVPAGAEELSFGKAPSAMGLAGQAARVFGSVAPGVLTSFITKSATPGAAFGFGQAGGEGIDTAREHISKMSDIELARKSEYYRNLLLLGYPPSEARKMTEDKAADTAAYYQGITGALGGAFTGNLVAGKLDKLKLMNAQNILGRIVQGGAVGMTEEGLQELMEGIATDLGINRTVVREIGVDSFANLVLGAIGGGGPGAVGGAVTKPEGQVQQAPTVPGGPAPMAGADTGAVTPPAVPPTAPPPVKMAEIKPEELEEETPPRKPVTAVTPPEVPEEGPLKGLSKVESLLKRLKPEIRQEFDALKNEYQQLKGQPETPESNARKEQIQARVDEIFANKAYRKPIYEKLPNDPAIEKEALALADELEKVGDTASSDGLRTNIANVGGYTDPKKLDYYKNKLLEAQQKVGKAKEMPKEKVSMTDYMGIGYENDLKRVEEFLNTATYYKKLGRKVQASQEVRDAVAKTNEYLQKITDRINELGYTYLGQEHDAPKEVKDLRSKLSHIAGSTNRLIKDDESIIKQYKRGNWETLPEQQKQTFDLLEKDYAEIDQILGREAAKPKATEVVEENRYSWANTHKPIVNPNEAELKAIEIYKKIKAENPDADLEDEISNPNVGHPIKEEPNPLGIKIGDLVYNKGDSKPRIAITVGEDSVKLINPKTGHGLFSQYDEVSKEPIGHDYHFDFGYGPLDVDVSKWFKDTNEWQFKIYGPGASESGFRSVIGPVFEGKRGTKEFEKFVEEVVKANTGKKFAKPKKPTKEEKVAANKARQKEKKAAVKAKTAEVTEENISPAKKEQDQYARSVRTDDDRYSLKDIQEAVKKLQKDETDYPVKMSAFDNRNLQSLLAVAQKNGFVSINKSGSVFPAYDAKTVEQNKRNYEEDPDSFDNQKARALEKLKDKEAVIKDIQESRKISREYAEKVYDHYLNFYTKRYDYLRDGKYDLWDKLQNEHNKFEKRLQAVANRSKSKEGKIEANKARQEEKKAAAKPSTAVVPKLNEEWASHRKEPLKEKPYSMDQEVWDRYQELQKGNFAFDKVSFTGAHALARANAANKERKKVYEKAIDYFLNYPITAKAPTKNQPKLEISHLTGSAFPPPISKNIKVAKTLEDQKKAMLTIAAGKNEARMMLQGVLVEPNQMVVTDGHRLALYKTNTGVSEKTLLDKDGKVIDMQYPNYERILDKVKNAKSYGMVNAEALGNYVRGTRNAWKYVSLDKNSPFSIQLKNGDKPIPFNGRYIEDMANMFRQFGYDGFDIQYNDSGMLNAVSPDGKLSQIVMGVRDLNLLFQPFNVEENRAGLFRTPEEDAKLRKELGLSEEVEKKEIKAEEPGVVVDDEGEKLTFPLFVDLANKGYKVLGFDNPRTYENKGGKKFRTIEKDGVRLAFEPSHVLFSDPKYPNRPPQLGYGNSDQIVWQFLGVDKDQRKQGKATQAIKDLIEVADKNKYTIYGEPAQLETESMTADQLSNFYSKFGFKPRKSSNKVIIREPGAKAQTQAEIKEADQDTKSLATIRKDLVRFASGMSGLSDLISGSYWRAGHKNYGVGFDVGLLSKNAIDQMAHYIVNMDTQVFIDSGAFSHFRKQLKGKQVADLDFDKILAKYGDILYAIGQESENQGEKVDYPRPMLVMPDIVGDQKASLELIDHHKDWIASHIWSNLAQPIIPLQKGELTLSEAYDKVIETLKSNKRDLDFNEKKLIFGIPSNAEAVSRYDLIEFLSTSKPARIHFLGAAADSKLNPLLQIVAHVSPGTKVTADASKVRSAILNGVTKGKTRDQAIKDALYEAEDPMVLMSRFGDADIIDVIATEINPEQVKLLTNQTNKLSDDEISTLEEHYDAKSGSDEFFKLLREDIIKYVNKGADAVDAAIRDIIKKLQAGLLSVAMVFNPAYMSQQSAVVYPTQAVTQQVTAAVPESAKAMSDSGKKAYANLYPALQQELQKNNKYFTVVDKPTSKVFVFNPDGSLMTQSNVVLGKALGDTYVGKTDFVQNRITPAGLFKPKAEKGSATYDGKTVYTLGNVKEGWNAVFMHTVYLKESDAEARKKALATGETTRLSHGCINGPSELMEKIDNDSMNESHVFIVPDNQAMTDDYIANNVSNEDLTRETVTPVTVTTKVPGKGARAIGAIDIVGREEEAVLPRTQAEINRERQLTKLAQSKPYYNDFTNSIDAAQFKETAPEIREEKIKEYSKLRSATRRAIRKVAAVGSDISMQRNLNDLLAAEEALKSELDATKITDNRAITFKVRAQEAIRDGDLDPEVADVIDTIYKRYPGILEGLRLSIREEKQPSKSAGNFNPYARIVTLWKGSSGVTDPSTVRHELVHSLEQMMTPETKKAVVEAWAKSFQKAIRDNKDVKSQAFFNAVMDFLENPSKETFNAATNIMPDIRFYQYMNPSEFWAVNAEKLFASKLGTPWARFVTAIKKIFEALKSTFGFNSKYAIHKAFDEIINGKLERSSKEMLLDYMYNGKVKLDFLNSIEDIETENENVPEVPDTDPKTFKEMMIGSWNRVQENAADIVKNPRNNAMKGLENASEGILYARIKNAWFGAGLEARDLAKYGGKIRTTDNMAIASLAVKNAIHAGSISTQVLIQGGLEYSQDFMQFIAVKRDHSMSKVANLQYEIRKKLGKKQGDKTINAYLVAKRSRSIYNTYVEAQAKLELAIDNYNEVARSGDDEARTDAYLDMQDADRSVEQAIIAYQKIPTYLRQLDEKGESLYETVEDRNGNEYKLPVLDDNEIDKFINRENKYPELTEILENFTAVNHEMIDAMVKGYRISEKEGKRLKAIKDYVPWNRVMDEAEELFDNRKIPSMPSNIKYFKKGETDRHIANIIDNMNHNVTMMTRSAIRNYAQVRIIQEYARRKDNGKLQVYPSEGRYETGVRVPAFISGRRAIFEIPDEMVAEAILGMISPPYEIPFQKAFSAAAQLVRRTVTFSAYFQLKQVFYDAPTAAWVSGVRNPLALWSKCFTGFVKAVNPLTDDPVVQVLRSAGIGGFQSFHRTAKKEQEIELGLIHHSKFAYLLRAIDHIGDASDYSQRIATYNQVLKETGDKGLAMMQAADVIDFQKHGNGRLAQALRVSVSFMQAYATQLDVLTQAAVGGNIKGQSRKKAAAKFYATGGAMIGIMILYAMMSAGDDDYHELDDDTRARNLYVPYSKKIFGHHILIPLRSTAAMFYKVVPELLYYRISQEGTKNEMDRTRFWKAMGEAAVDMVLGPTPIPSGLKGGIEISLDRNFYTGGKITPNYLKNLEASRQFTASTSELGKLLSAATQIPFTGDKTKENKRVLSPIQADHLMRSLLGSAASISMYWSNMVFNANRPEAQLKENPLTGGIIGADVPRRNENLFYDLKERADEVYATFQDIVKNDRKKAAEYRENNLKMIQAHGYTSGMEQNLNAINAQIRRLSRSEDLTKEEREMTPAEKRERINYFNQKKQDILKDVIERRKAAGL